MSRKRSVSGRARARTAENKIRIQTEKINKRIKSLEKAGRFGTYKSKELLTFVKDNSNLSIKKSRGSKRHKVIVKNLRNLTFGKLALIGKKFKEVLSSKGFTPVGIKDIEKKTRMKVSKTLEGMIGRKISKKDLELFYEIIRNKANEILDRIPPSDFYVLVQTARESNMNEDEWVEMLNNYVNINNESLREAGEYLYNKYIG